MYHPMNEIVLLRNPAGALTRATIISPPLGMSELPALGNFYTVSAADASFPRIQTVHEQRIVRAPHPQAPSANIIVRDISASEPA